ncbi:membrane protein [Klebsiella pneumoniae]|uniref:Membrane protein n=1 Tax=Klebsiella pneumoniae TaxID=573 RepID=A0A4P0YHM1_KLEPN|nr:membrane protein [Klebsiella pneumoniae]
MDKRFVQAHKEARWALWLTLLYLAAWLAAAYCRGGYWLYRPATLV